MVDCKDRAEESTSICSDLERGGSEQKYLANGTPFDKAGLHEYATAHCPEGPWMCCDYW